MNTVAYLKARGWTMYRKPWEGKPAMWIHPRDNHAVYQREAVKIEREIERKVCTS